jgi:nucleoid DNA-binding protein
MVLGRARNDFGLQEKIRKIEEEFSLSESIVAGDFTSRLSTAVHNVIRVVRKVENPADLRSQLTNIMFEVPIPRLRDAITSLKDHFTGILFLIDDLDKGWPARQVESLDIAMVKHLIEELNDEEKIGISSFGVFEKRYFRTTRRRNFRPREMQSDSSGLVRSRAVEKLAEPKGDKRDRSKAPRGRMGGAKSTDWRE